MKPTNYSVKRMLLRAVMVVGFLSILAPAHAQPDVLERILHRRDFAPLSRAGCFGDAYPSALWVFPAPESPAGAVAQTPEEALLALAAAALFDETTVRILEQALMDPDPGVRETAIEALTDIGGGAAARALAFALGDEEPALREDAVYALGEIGGEAAIRTLQQALADEQSSVREAAAEVLSELSSEGR